MTGRALSLACALALAAGAAAAADPGPPDFAGNCQRAVAAKAGVEPATVKVRGKYKGQDGRINLDFILANGKVGVCRAKPDATVDEVKLEGDK